MSKRALLVGVNRYKVPGADLRGCVNDVVNLKSVLPKYYGFPKGNLKTLLDLQATKKNIQTGIANLIRGAKRGDVLLLHFSEHGSNVPDNGALTYHLVAAINEKKGQITHGELHARTIALLKKGRYDQVPQLEGQGARFNQPFLAPVV